MSTATQPATKPALSPTIFKFRVMLAGEIVGTFSNLPLAEETGRIYRGSVVLEFSAGKWIRAEK